MQYWSGYILIGTVGVVVWCDVTTLTSQSQPSLTCYFVTHQKSLIREALEAPTFCHYFDRDPHFANLPRKGSQILTNMANENLKVSTPSVKSSTVKSSTASDDFGTVPNMYLVKIMYNFRFWEHLEDWQNLVAQ